jgi:phenylpropionate dioxygenase-like ring-hydroxylating dioxygenase large terminal subunit
MMSNKSSGGTLTAGQRKALAAVPELKDSVFPAARASIPAWTYTDQARFDSEKSLIFQKRPMAAVPAAVMPKRASYFHTDIIGMPVLLTRSSEGAVSAFVNVCRHRGAKLCTSADAVVGTRIVCPYHAWTYRLDGSLFNIPRQEIFPGIDKTANSLLKLPALEAGGLIWVGLHPQQEVDFSSVRGEIEEDLDALGLKDMWMYEKATFPVKANWKLVMDTMLDAYHVTRLHKDSLARFFVDTENLIHSIGPHVRNTSARGNFSRSAPIEDFETARQVTVFAYTLFPNAIVVVSPHFVSLAILRPMATDRTDVDYYMLTNHPPTDDRQQELMRRSFELMQVAFGKEDFWAAELCHAGLRTGTLKEVQLGGMEIQMALFHDAVNECLGAAGKP